MRSEKKCGKLFIVSAPSGAGKTTLVNALIKELPIEHAITRLVTYTSKTPRINELHGIDYHFISNQEFEQKIAEQFFLEWSGAYGSYYGTARFLLDQLASGNSFIAVVDRSGAKRLKQEIPQAVMIWVHTVNVQVLEDRLRVRNTETQEEIERRLALAKKELAEEQENRLYNHHILNDFFEKALKELKDIIILHHQ
ncbi:MAG TPA: guanylate kinase [Candidatus Babeliales bacterium]|nr:guanylate kinase [Candidatus Babeliales bacterium]